jgi:hypothetical protein
MSESSSPGEARGRGSEAGVLRSLAALYSSRATLPVNAALFAAYYLLFYETIVRSNGGFFLLAVPYPLFLSLVLASSVLATVALSYLRTSRRVRDLTGVAQSPISLAAGALVASCACSIPLLAPLLYLIGLNAIEVSGVVSFLAAYQSTITGAIVVLDVASVFYYLRLISRAGPPSSRTSMPS